MQLQNDVDISVFKSNVSNIIEWIVMEINFPLRTNWNNFGEPMTFDLVPTSREKKKTLLHDQILSEWIMLSWCERAHRLYVDGDQGKHNS